MVEKAKVLIIEDEQDIREGLEGLLGQEYDVQLADGGIAGLKLALRSPPDLVLLDLHMNDFDGFQTCKAFRDEPEFNSVPIIVLTAYNEARDRTRAFEIGADDYIAKPFDNAELLARINRKIQGIKSDQGIVTSNSGILNCGSMRLNTRNQELQIGSKNIVLSSLEFKLLHFLACNCNKLVSRSKIIENVWEDKSVSERIIDPHILSIRAKLSGSEVKISSVYRGGYILKTRHFEPAVLQNQT